LEWLKTSCEEEEAKLNRLESKKIRLKRLVKRFKDNNEEYRKIKKTVIQQVTSLLFDVKGILRLSLDSLMKSMRTDPQKYSKLIYYNGNSSAVFEEYKSTLLEEAEKLYTKSVKELTEQIITEYSSKYGSSQLYKPERKQSQQFYSKPSNRLLLPTAIPNNQAYPFKRVKHIFVKTEFRYITTIFCVQIYFFANSAANPRPIYSGEDSLVDMPNFRSEITPEAYIFAIGGILCAASVFTGWYNKYRQRRYINRYLTRIKSTYDTLHDDDKKRCILQLQMIRTELLYKKGSLSYSHYNILDKKVFDYCVAIALSSNDSIIVMSFCGMNRDLICLRLRFALNFYSSLVRRKQKEEKTGEYVSIK